MKTKIFVVAIALITATIAYSMSLQNELVTKATAACEKKGMQYVTNQPINHYYRCLDVKANKMYDFKTEELT